MMKVFFIIIFGIFGILYLEIRWINKENNERFKVECIEQHGEYSESKEGLLCTFNN